MWPVFLFSRLHVHTSLNTSLELLLQEDTNVPVKTQTGELWQLCKFNTHASTCSPSENDDDVDEKVI